MANPPVNPKQFGADHQESISSVEGAHGVGFTRMGLQYGGGRKFAPIANISASRSGASFLLATEDPSVANTIFLTTPSRSHPEGLVATDENHTYPDSGKRAWRYNMHADVDSAMEHLAQGVRERAGHIEAKTMPENKLDSPKSGVKWTGSIGWQVDDASTGPDASPLRPPSTISYSGSDPTDTSGLGTYYDVDTETRERIPGRDQ